MELSENIYRQIIESITIVGTGPAQAADRRAPRLTAATYIGFIPWSAPTQSLMVRIRDLSPGGMGILHSEKMALDEQFVARLPVGAGNTQLVLCSVVYWEPLATNLCTIGVQFLQLLNEAELIQHQNAPQPPAEGILARMTHALARRRKIAS